jgi:hypothetical protein
MVKPWSPTSTSNIDLDIRVAVNPAAGKRYSERKSAAQ